MGKKNGRKGMKGTGGGGLVLASNGAQLALPTGGGGGPKLKEGASDVLWEGGASFMLAKWLQGEIDSIYAKHNLKRVVVPVDPKKPHDESAAQKDIRALCLKVGVGGVFGRRMLANNGDLAHHGTTAAVHQAAGAMAAL